MTYNNCKQFSIGKLKVKAKYNYGRKYYFIWILKCRELEVTLGTVEENKGLEDISVPAVSPCWNCPNLQELRKKDEIPHFELSIMNGYTNNDFEQWIEKN